MSSNHSIWKQGEASIVKVLVTEFHVIGSDDDWYNTYYHDTEEAVELDLTLNPERQRARQYERLAVRFADGTTFLIEGDGPMSVSKIAELEEAVRQDAKGRLNDKERKLLGVA